MSSAPPGAEPVNPQRARGWIYERRLLAGALLTAAPALSGLVTALITSPLSAPHMWVLCCSVVFATLVIAWQVRRQLVFPLYTLSNLLEALREGDYSMRGSHARRGDAIGDVVWEINTLSATLREQRLAAEEKSALFSKVIAALDIAVLAFDDERHLKLLNPAAERLLGAGFEKLAGKSARALGLDDCLDLFEIRMFDRSFPGGSGRWEVRRARFREHGRPHDLLVITDLSRALREEERLAWQRLLRVLGHELNNSLAPIRSMAATLIKLLANEELPGDWRDDARSGLNVIGTRAEALSRFMGRYTALAQLPPPRPRRVRVDELARRVVRLEQRLEINVEDGPPVEIHLDPDQIEQVLINLLGNAVDATTSADGSVRLRWRVQAEWLEVEIVDDGAGLPSSENLFVPFFTTKTGGSGIGLVLARQIVEAHGGSLVLENRVDTHGCVAQLRLPRRQARERANTTPATPA